MESTNGRKVGESDCGTTTTLVSSSASMSSNSSMKLAVTELMLPEGYFDDIAAVFIANQHPIIFLDAAAMRWMGARLSPNYNIDLLVKDNQVDDILDDFLATGLFERVEQDLKGRLCDQSVSSVPRVCYIEYSTCLSLWSESAYMLPISSGRDELVKIRDVMALNPNLVEERFDPYAGQDSSLSTSTDRLKRGTKIFRPVHGLSAKFKCPLYIPSLPRFIDALLDQIRRGKQELRAVRECHGYLSSYNVGNLIRYLYLETPSQREKLLPVLAERNRADMEMLLNRYKRKPLFF